MYHETKPQVNPKSAAVLWGHVWERLHARVGRAGGRVSCPAEMKAYSWLLDRERIAGEKLDFYLGRKRLKVVV